MQFFENDKKSALEAKEAALWISFAPMVFQAARALRDTGVLESLLASGEQGLLLGDICAKCELPRYGARVLLEAGLSIGLLTWREKRYHLSKTGYFLLNDELARVNMDFVQEICYRGISHLGEAVRTGKPAGLKELGPWRTVYDGLSELPPAAQKSWFAFDHYFSDTCFPEALKLVFKDGEKKVLDIGGNTGKWAIACAKHNPEISITICDLPGQLEMAAKNIAAAGLSSRISLHPIDALDDTLQIPSGYDAIWMSQFLDCFSEDRITAILKACHDALQSPAKLYILETFWDRQRFEAAAFCLHQTSLYFTAIANGDSQLYHSEDFLACVSRAGFEITEQIDHLGLGHTLVKCRKA